MCHWPQAQENPSPPKKTGPAWGGAGVAPAVVEKKKDGTDWADECEDEEVRRPRSISIGSAPSASRVPFGGRDIDPDIIMRDREMARGSNDRSAFGGGFHDRDRYAARGVGGMDRDRRWDGPARSGFGDGDRGYGSRGDVGAREKWIEKRPGDVKILRSDNASPPRRASLGDSGAQRDARHAVAAVTAVATEPEQLKNEDANPRKVEHSSNPTSIVDACAARGVPPPVRAGVCRVPEGRMYSTACCRMHILTTCTHVHVRRRQYANVVVA